jgi:two-component system, OmpR family, response regulator
MPRISRPLSRPKILLVDDRGLMEELCADLQNLGYCIHHIEVSGEDPGGTRAGAAYVVGSAQHGVYDLPLAEAFHQENGETPIFVIRALSRSAEHKYNSEFGSDQHRQQALDIPRTAADLRHLSSLLENLRVTKLRAGDLEMDLIERTVRRGRTSIDLSPREFAILEYFLRRPGRLITRAILFKEVWRYRFAPDTNAIDMHVSNLRKKIDVAGEMSLISNIRGEGFMWNANM